MIVAMAMTLLLACEMPTTPAQSTPTPPPPAAQAAAAPTPIPVSGQGLQRVLSRIGLADVVLVLDDGSATWWSRTDGALGPAIPLPASAPAALSADGRLFWLADGGIVSAAKGAQPTHFASLPELAFDRLAVGLDDRVLAAGPGTLVAFDAEGSPTATLARPLDAAGWMGSRVVVAAGRAVSEIHPTTGAERPAGMLPEGALRWQVGPDGVWVGWRRDEVVIHPPAQLTADVPLPARAVALPEGARELAWLDTRLLAFATPRGLVVFDDGKPLDLAGDLATGTPATLLVAPRADHPPNQDLHTRSPP